MNEDQNTEEVVEDVAEEAAPEQVSEGSETAEAKEEATKSSAEAASGEKPAEEAQTLKATPLWALHKERRGKMVPFAGYEMPVQYRRGIMEEHKQTRERAGLFDVSHMGQAFLVLDGEGGHDDIAALIETLVPGEIKGLKPGGIRYTLLLNEEGGIMDDLMVTRPEGEENEGMLFLVVNAATKEGDFAYISEKLNGKARLILAGDRALMALQGPRAAKVLKRLAPFVETMGFMTAKAARIDGVEVIVSRCGYTGEDGFEISVPAEMAEAFARKLLGHREVQLIGLGARDSLRLEAGLCLYGHDIDEETTPIEAGLTWAIGKRRKMEKDFPGAEKIMSQLMDGAPRRRVGIKPKGRAPAREGTEIVNNDGDVIGKITSGGFGPTIKSPIAMGYVDASLPENETEIGLLIRGKVHEAEIVPLPFVEQRYYRADKVEEEDKDKNGRKRRKRTKKDDKKPAKEKKSAKKKKADVEEPETEKVSDETAEKTKAEVVEIEIKEASEAPAIEETVAEAEEETDERS
ncbi:MAG: glycine cleavage system aminomethyltransferase GcvT [Alphaproteobacteria bacterium]|nr:MAG: glycine cleavage system aminomethyltransferase GcvT [Alphaproteobacteria bacterium]